MGSLNGGGGPIKEGCLEEVVRNKSPGIVLGNGTGRPDFKVGSRA